MATSDFLPLAVGVGANVETQAAYAAETALLANGFQAGVAPSAKFNKALRQSTIMAAVLAKWIADTSGVNSVDDGSTATLISNLTASVNNLIAAGGSPSGSVSFFASNTAPSGYLKANGAAVSRTAYASLFAVIGTTFGGGDGVTTFTLPDLRGEFLRGWDDSRGVDSGRVFGSSQADDFKSHTHAVLVNSGQLGSGGGSNYLGQSNLSGATGGTETRPRNVALLACIKY